MWHTLCVTVNLLPLPAYLPVPAAGEQHKLPSRMQLGCAAACWLCLPFSRSLLPASPRTFLLLQDGPLLQSRRIVDRESEYSRRRLDRIISPDRNDAFQVRRDICCA